MGKATRWIKNMLGLKKETKQSQQAGPAKDEIEKAGSDLSTKSRSKERRRWSFGGKSVKNTETSSDRGSGLLVDHKSLYNENFGTAYDTQQSKHAIAVAAATAAAADAALTAANAAAAVVRLTGNGFSFSDGTQREQIAATKIQTAFRGYLARKALYALRGLVKLQALVRGHIVRKQAAETLNCMHALIRVQARVRARRIRMSDEGQAVQTKLIQRRTRESHPSISNEGRNQSTGSSDKLNRKVQSRNTAPVKYDRGSYSASSQQEMETSSLDGNTKIVEMDTGRTKSSSKKWMASVSDSVSMEPSISSTTSAAHYPPRHNQVPYSSQRAQYTPHYKSTAPVQAAYDMTSQFSQMSIPRPPPDVFTTLSSHNISPLTMYGDYGYDEDSVFSTAESTPQLANSAVSRYGGKQGPITPRSEYAESLFDGFSAYPSYMANTESSKAKARCHSAPKQRPSSIEKNAASSRRRMSLYSAADNRPDMSSSRMRRSSSVVTPMRNGYQNSGPFLPDRSKVTARQNEFDVASMASGY